MRKVKNHKVIRRIADRTRKAGKGRNLIAVLAIALTTVLFTAVFTVGGSIITKQQEAAMRQVGGTSHASYKYLTQEEYDIVRKDEKLREVSFRIQVGDAVNEDLVKLRTEVGYYEDLDARMSFCYPETGRMPQKEDEIVLSDLTLRALGIPCEIGTKVPLSIRVNDVVHEDIFTLCGYFQGDPIARSQVAAVSRAYADRVAPTPKTSVMDTDIDGSDYAGRITADFNFAFGFNLGKQVAELSRRCGFPEDAPAGINWAYMGEEANLELLLLIVGLLLMILASGYLIIYNIFYINIYQDIRHYGLLKTIGMTGRQLRRMVYRQAYMLSLYGIPAGLVIGVLVGKIMLPVVMGNFDFTASEDAEIELKVWVFAGAAAFAFLTVMISCIKPCRIASKVSPVEAVRYTEGQDTGSRRQKAGRGRKAVKKTRRVNPRALAAQNIRRNRKKVVIVVASLSMALVLLNSIYSLIRGFDMDRFVSGKVLSDFSVSDATLDNFSVTKESIVTDGVTADFLRDLERQEGMEEIGNIYVKEIDPVISEENYALIEERIFDNPKAQATIEWKFGDDPELLDYYREEHYMDGKVYGISEFVMNLLENPGGELDWEKFNSGDYVIASRFDTIEEEGIDFFLPGEKVTVYNEAGEGREYEVLASADMPYACGLQWFGTCDCDYFLPEGEYLDLMGEQQPMRTLFNVMPGREAAVDEWLSNYCENVDPALMYTSKAKIVDQFMEFKNLFALTGSLLAFILGLIGVLNFINTIVTSVLSREQEFAMMEAVGMTGGQLRRMLCFEGGYYALYTGIFSVILSAAVSVLVVKPYGDEMFFFRWHFTLMPLALCLPVLLAVVLLVPAACHRSMNRVSVVERMRQTIH